jgi:hypothetical protein
MKTFNEIAAEYRPYHTIAAFQIGAQDYMDGRHINPYGSGAFRGRSSCGLRAAH